MKISVKIHGRFNKLEKDGNLTCMREKMIFKNEKIKHSIDNKKCTQLYVRYMT